MGFSAPATEVLGGMRGAGGTKGKTGGVSIRHQAPPGSSASLGLVPKGSRDLSHPGTLPALGCFPDAAVHQGWSGVQVSSFHLALLCHGPRSSPLHEDGLSPGGKQELLSVEISHHIQGHTGTTRNEEMQQARLWCLHLPLSISSEHRGHLPCSQACPGLRMGAPTFLHKNLCVLLILHHTRRPLCFRSSTPPVGSACFSEHRLLPNWLISLELDASFELMLIFITCVFIWIPSERTSAIPYRKGDKYDPGSDILALDLLRIASHLKHLMYSLEGMILSVAEVQGNLADCIVHFFVFFFPLFIISSIVAETWLCSA